MSFLQNGRAKSACVVLVANRSLCIFNGETPSYSHKEISGLNVFQVVQVGWQGQIRSECAVEGEAIIGSQIGRPFLFV